MNIVFYGRTQVGSVVLSYLVAQGHRVKVIPEDDIVSSLVTMYDLEEVTLDTMGEFDLFVCCHGKKIIKPEYLEKGTFINMHSCLFKYKGKDPISRYIENKDTEASIESHYMVEEVDGGEVIESVLFDTPVVKTHGEYFNIALPHYYTCIHNTLKKIGWGSSAAMTRYSTHKDRLNGWMEYYSRYFDKLYIFGDNKANKPEIDYLLEWYEAEYIETNDGIYSENSHRVVWDWQKKLLEKYEWVLYTDMDERVVADPNQYKDLKEYMKRSNEEQTFCEGWEVLRYKDQEMFDWKRPVTEQRGIIVRDMSGSYNKPALSRIPTDWALGFHYIQKEEPDKIKARMNTGLYMFHLKHVDSIDVPKYCNSEIKYIPDRFKGLF